MEYLRVCSWNINGLRSLKPSLKDLWDSLNSDIICLQETKASRVSILCRDPLKPIETYHSIYELLDKHLPTNSCSLDVYDFIASTLNISRSHVKALDSEGRIIGVKFPVEILQTFNNNFAKTPLIVLSTYVPRLNSEDSFSDLVIAGDFNLCHKNIDYCNPDELKFEQTSLLSRQWFDKLLIDEQRDPILFSESSVGNLVDVFRLAHPNRKNAYTCWSSRTRGRLVNYGVRLDYILFTSKLVELFPVVLDKSQMSDLMPWIEGSDHCPVWTILPYSLNQNSDVLNYALTGRCSRFWIQCQNKQTSIKNFLQPQMDEEKSEKSTSTLSIIKSDALPSISENINLENKSLIQSKSNSEQFDKTVKQWRNLLTGPRKPPLCKGHSEPCVLRTIKQLQTQNGNRKGRRFWVCSRPQGSSTNPEARCNTFVWDDRR